MKLLDRLFKRYKPLPEPVVKPVIKWDDTFGLYVCVLSGQSSHVSFHLEGCGHTPVEAYHDWKKRYLNEGS